MSEANNKIYDKSLFGSCFVGNVLPQFLCNPLLCGGAYSSYLQPDKNLKISCDSKITTKMSENITDMNNDIQKAYEQILKRRAYSAEYMRKFRAERRDEYNAQRRAMYAKKKAKEKEQSPAEEKSEE